MKLPPPDNRNALSARHTIFTLAAVALLPLLLYGSAPSWWSPRGVLNQNAAPDDYAPVNQGQLKNIAKAAAAEMDAKLPGGAGAELHALINSWLSPNAATNDFAPVNLGQLKTVAKPFYDRLIAAGLALQYPWSGASSQSDDFAVANLGQVKNVFSFELPAVDPLFDGDHNGLPDQWERQYFGATGIAPNADADGDGASNLQEYIIGTAPTDFFNGALPGLSVTGGDQFGIPGTRLPVPISVRIHSLYSYAIANAPVTVTVVQGGARLLPDQTGSAMPSVELNVRANAYGNDGYPVAQVFVLLAPNPGASVIRISAGAGSQSTSVITSAIAIDPSLVAPSNLVVTATSASSARLTWSSANTTSVTTVQASVDGGRTWIALGAVAPGVSQATVTGLTPNQPTRFRVYPGGTPSVGDSASFHLPDPSSGPPPVSPPPGPQGPPTDSVEVVPLGAPVMEIETSSVSRGKFGFPGLLNQGGPYRDQTVVITSDYKSGDGTPDPSTGSTTVTKHWQRSEDGGSSYVITTTNIIGGGGYLNSPWTTVTNTDTVFRQEGAPFFGSTGGSSRTITLSNLYTDGEIAAEYSAVVPPFYNEFWTSDQDARAFLSKGPGGFQITFLQYRFKVNADPYAVVTWDVQFTPRDGGPVRHDIQSWSSNGSTQSPTYLLDPRAANDGQNGSYKVVLVSAELMVDGNRDNEMSFYDPDIHYKDLTTSDKPYRFWLNDDDDGAAADLGDHVPVATPDYVDGVIQSARDLEDFSRLHVNLLGLEEALEKGSVTAAFEWRHQSGTPKVKLYRAVSEGTDYLTSTSVATSSTLSPFRDTLGEVVAGIPLFIPQTFWVSDSPYANVPSTLPVAWLLFEGSGEGTGELILSFWKDGHRVGSSGGVWLDLRNIKRLYQHHVLGGPDPWGGVQFEPAVDEQKEVLVFVHGWRLSPDDTANFAETAFKRTWWRGFKGRFAAVRWDTYYNSRDHGWVPYVGQTIDAYLGKYNDSEHNAWLAGAALKGFVENVPPDYTKSLIAHSMGNVVAGSALQLGMVVTNYALLNAALPASCYDDRNDLRQAPATVTVANLPLHLWTQLTPDDDPDPATRALAYRGRLKNVTGNLVNFYLPDDYATSFAWEVNNRVTKPPLASLAGPFVYRRDFPSGQKLIKGIEDPSTGEVTVQHYITDANEAQPYACQTWGKAVGAEARAGGPLKSRIDLSADVYSPSSTGGFADQHSAEFNYDIQRLRSFYTELLTQLKVSQNP